MLTSCYLSALPLSQLLLSVGRGINHHTVLHGTPLSLLQLVTLLKPFFCLQNVNIEYENLASATVFLWTVALIILLSYILCAERKD
jgi:hypothetical protein